MKINKKVNFVEDKCVDAELVASLLKKSAAKNAWTNGGPVLHLLEQELTQIIDNENLRVVCTANCTLSIQAAVQCAMYTEGKKLNWVGSSFSFYATQLNDLQTIHLLDCDERGFLSLTALKALDPDSYGGFIVTNIFGYQQNLDNYINFAAEQDKYLIIDNASGLLALDRQHYHEKVIEVVSFHHTKPFGFGEGGLVIANVRHESIIRKLINFGIHLENNFLNLGTNGKLSDIGAAYILQRLHNKKAWMYFYQMQASRIDAIAQAAGLQRLLRPITHEDILGNLPFLSQQKKDLSMLDNPYVVLQKYYKPLASTPEATNIYDHIINIPCHPDMANIKSEVLYDLFKSLN